MEGSTDYFHKAYIHVKTKKDDQRCWITGMAVLNCHQLILADSKNFSVKLVDVTTNRVVDELQMVHYPLDVAVVDEQKCVVTVPVDRAIRFINVSMKTLSSSYEMLQVDGDCRGVCFYANRLVITYSCPAKVQILELDGTVLKTIMLDSLQSLIFSEPYSISANNNYIIVSDQGKNGIIILNWIGDVLCSVGSDGSPHGVTVIENVFLFVSGHAIYKHDHSQKEIVVVGNEFQFPYAIAYSETKRLLFVSFHKGDRKNDNYLQVLERYRRQTN